MTIGELKELIEDKPDSAIVVTVDEYGEHSFDSIHVAYLDEYGYLTKEEYSKTDKPLRVYLE